MFASNNDALSHLDSQVLSWMSLDVTREDLLHKINKVLKEYAASCCNLFQEYEFISVEKLKESKDVYKSSMQLSDANIGASCLKGHAHLQRQTCNLLIGCIKNIPRKQLTKKSLLIGHLFLEDGSDSIAIMCIDVKPCLLGSLVLIPEWTFIPCSNSKKLAIPYVEVQGDILELELSPNHEHKLSPLCADVTRRKISDKEIDLSDRVVYLSPVHRIANSSPFFMVKLESISYPILVLDEDKMCWWHFMKPGLIVDLIKMKHAKLNKGSADEREIIRTIPDSQIKIFDKKQIEIGDETNGRKNGGLISYMGTITDCSLAERGIFELDNRSRLIVTHQPCHSCCNGLRIGAKICVYNLHLVVVAKVPYMVCCSCTTIKIVEFSPQLTDHRPFLAVHNCFTKNCQEIRIKEYLHWIQLSDDLTKRFTFLQEKKAATLAKELLNSYLSYIPVKRNVIQEFFSEPHQCIVTSENPSPPPNINSIESITTLLCKEFVQSTDKMPWFQGDEYDRLSGLNTETGNSWSYKLISAQDIGDAVILGELVLCHTSGELQLQDESGTIDLEIVPSRFSSVGQRDRLYNSLFSTVFSGHNSICVLRNYHVVLEKTKDSRSQLYSYKTYLLTDPHFTGNSIFIYPKSTPKDPKTDKRKQDVNNWSALDVSKRRKFDSLANKETTCKGSTAENHTSTLCSTGDARLSAGDCANETQSFIEDKKQNLELNLVNVNDRICVKDDESMVSFEGSGFYLLVIFIQKVAVLQRLQKDGDISYCAYVNGAIIGRLNSSQNTGCSAGNSLMEVVDEMNVGNDKKQSKMALTLPANDLQFEALKSRKLKALLEIDERFNFDYMLIKSGCFYLLKSKVNVLDSDGGSVRVNLRLRSDTILYHAELKQEEFVINGYGSFVVPKDCIKSIEEELTIYYQALRKRTSVRYTLKLGSAFRNRTWSFSGLIISRGVKVSTPWGVKERTSVVMLRVKDLKSLDEIVVYISPDIFCLPQGCLPGVQIHFKDIEIKVSQTKNIYCSVTAATEIRLLCFDETDLRNLQEYAPMTAAVGDSIPDYRRNLMWFHEGKEDASNLTWELKLDFITVRWAEIYWKCKICKEKVNELICSRGCPQEWKFISQMSVIADDGTSQAYLQIEQSLLRSFLALPDPVWKQVMETTKCKTIIYQRDIEYNVQQNLAYNIQSGRKISKRKQVESILWRLFQNINQRPSYIVNCKLFNQGTPNAMQGQVRTIKVGTEEYMTKAPKKINLQAIRISSIDHATEINRIIEEINK